MKRTISVACIGVLLSLLGGPSVHARGPEKTTSVSVDATPVAVSGPLAKFWGYVTPLLVVDKGGDLTYTNIDAEKHDLVHDAASDGFGGPKKMRWCKKPKKDDHGHHHHHGPCPVFWSNRIGLGQTTNVLGLENLKPGTIYTFFCTLHHGMKGTLIAR